MRSDHFHPEATLQEVFEGNGVLEPEIQTFELKALLDSNRQSIVRIEILQCFGDSGDPCIRSSVPTRIGGPAEMYYEEGGDVLDVERFRVSPTELEPGDVLVYKSPSPNSVPRPAGIVETVSLPTDDSPACVVRFGNEETAEWHASGESPKGMEVDGYAIRVPRPELRNMLEEARGWAMEDSHWPGLGDTAGADNPDRHPFDVEGFRTNPEQLEVGDFVVRAPSGPNAPTFRLFQVSEIDVSESPNEYAVRMASRTVASWERTPSTEGDESEVDGVVVRLHDHDLGVMLDYGFQRLSDHNDEQEPGSSLPSCPQCGSLHGPGEPCVY